jgi:hypothetical protein
MSEIFQYHLFSGKEVQKIQKNAITNPHVTNLCQTPTQIRCDVGHSKLSIIMPAGFDEYKLFLQRDIEYGDSLEWDLVPSCLLNMINQITPDITSNALYKLCNP